MIVLGRSGRPQDPRPSRPALTLPTETTAPPIAEAPATPATPPPVSPAVQDPKPAVPSAPVAAPAPLPALSTAPSTGQPGVAAVTEPPAPPFDPDAFRAQVEKEWTEQQEQHEKDLQTSFRMSMREDPQLQADALKAARALGIAPELAASNLEVAKAVVKERGLRLAEMRSKYPALWEQMDRVPFQQLVHDDLDNLRATEGTFEAMGRNLREGTLGNELGYIGLRQAMGMASQEELDRAAEIELQMAQHPASEGFLNNAAEQVGQMAQTVPLSLVPAGLGAAGGSALPGVGTAVGGSAGFTAGLFTVSGALQAGNAYRQLRARGVPHDIAVPAAFGEGALVGGLEAFAGKIAAQPFKAALRSALAKGAATTLAKDTARGALWTFVSDAAKTWLAETSVELTQDAVSSVVQDQAAAMSPDAKEGQALGQTLWETFQKVGSGMAVLALPGPAMKFVADARRARTAQLQTREFLQVAKDASASKVNQLDEDSHAEALNAMGARHGTPTVFIDADKLREVLHQADRVEVDHAAQMSGANPDEMARQMPPAGKASTEFGAKLPDAARQLADPTVTTIEIPAGDYAAKVFKTRVGDALAPHVRFDANGMSPAEAAAFEKNAPGLLKSLVQQGQEQERRSQIISDESQAIADKLRQQLLEAPLQRRFEYREAQQLSTLWRAVVEVQSERSGVTPAVFQASFPLSIGGGIDQQGLNSGNQPGQPPKGSFDPASWRINLAPNADLSTVLHEFSHALLHMYGSMAAQKVHPTVVDDFGTFLRWAQIKDAETWQAMSLEQQRERHEQFAAAWESWMFEGKAPTSELQPLFSRFLRILKRVYDVLTGAQAREVLQQTHQRDFGQPLLELTDDMRQVFARMLASEQQVKELLAVRGAVPTFQSQADAAAAGMSGDQWIEHQRLQSEADETAIGQMTSASLQDMRWLSAAKGKLLAKLQAKERKKREAIRKEIAPAIERMPVNRARRWLKTGEYVDADGNVTAATGDAHKLRRDAVPEDKRNKLRAFLLKDGVDPDVVAEHFGFRTGEAMVNELALAPDAAEAIEFAVDQRMLRKHSLLADPKQREAYIERTLHSQARRRFVATELKALEAAIGPVTDARKVAREAARLAIANRRMSDILSPAFSRAARRTSDAAAAAVRDGNVQAAIQLKRAHLFNEEMAALAIEAREELTKAREDWNRLWKADDELAKERDLAVVSAARAILELHGEMSHLRSGAGYMQQLRDNDPELFNELEDIVGQATLEAKPIPDMTLEEFRQMRETVSFLWTRARRDMEVEIAGRRTKRVEAVQALIQQGEKTLGLAKDQPGLLRAKDRRGLDTASLFTLLKRVEHTTRKIDEGKRGAWTTTIFEPLRNRVTGYMADRERLVKQLHERITKLDLSEAKIESKVDELGGQVFEGTKELIGACLHMGNESNLEKLLVGNGWAERKADGSVDTSGWWRFVRRMVQEGKLTREHVQFLQFVWDMNQNELRPIAQRTNRLIYGLYFQQIEPASFELFGETWAGGYVPSSVDLDHPRARHIPEKRKLEMLDDPDSRFRQSMASTGSGFRIARQKVDLPRLIDVRLQVQHLDDVLRYVHLQPAVRDITSILRDRDFNGYANAVDPTLISGLLQPWLERTARNRISKPGMNRRLDEFFGFLRRSTGLNFMFGSVRNALQQITGVSNALAYVKPRHLRAASWDVMRDFGVGDVRKRIAGLSPFMQQRLDSKLGQMHDDIDALMDLSWRGNVRRFTNKHGYFLQSWVQDRVDQAVWLGSFNQALEEAGADTSDADAVAHAVAEADSAVRRSQGSQTPIDVAAYEAGTPFTRLLTQFSGFFNVTLNQIAEARDHRVRAVMRSLVVPALGSAVIAALASGGQEWDDKDGNGNTDELAWWMFSTQLKAFAGLVPAFGPNVVKVLDDSPGDRLSLAPAAALYEAVDRLIGRTFKAAAREVEGKGQTAQSGTITGNDLRDLATVISAATGVPLAPLVRPISYLRDQSTGRSAPATGTVDLLRGLVTGQARRQ